MASMTWLVITTLISLILGGIKFLDFPGTEWLTWDIVFSYPIFYLAVTGLIKVLRDFFNEERWKV